MSIIRAPRPDSNWYTLDKQISEDERLSWAARGLLIFLLGKPDHWEVSVRHLINQTSKALGKSSGRDAVRVILKELEQAGYLKADIARSSGGVFNGMAYTVCEIPQFSPQTENPSPAEPQTDNPAPVKPAPAKPAPENHPLVKNESKQRIDLPAKTDLDVSADAKASGGALEGELLTAQAAKPPMVIEIGDKRFEIPGDLRYPGEGTKSYKAWMNYAVCYQRRYGAWPIINATQTSLICKFIDRVGEEMAPKVVAYYVNKVNDFNVTKSGHSLKLLLSDAEKYHMQYLTGRAITNTEAQQIDKTQTNFNVAGELEATIRARHAARASS